MLIFIILTVLLFYFYKVNIVYWLLKPMLTMSFFYLLYTNRHIISQFKLLQILGENSLQLYLIHPLFCLLFSPMFLKSFSEFGVIVEVIVILSSQLLIILFAFLVKYLIYKIEILRKFIFPKSYSELVRQK